MAELGVVGVGVATADPELRTVGDNKTSVCTVNLAFNRSFRDKEKEWQSEPCFLRVQVWGNRADRMAELVTKGQPIYVTGYLKQDSWTNDEGQKRIAYTIVARDFQLCTKSEKKNKSKSEKQEEAPVPSSVDDSELPF